MELQIDQWTTTPEVLPPATKRVDLVDLMGGISFVTISGACGAGKTRIVDELLLPTDTRLREAFSYTTRLPREEDRKKLKPCYRFVSREKFEAMEREGQFLWVSPFNDSLYGTRKQEVLEAQRQKHYPLLFNIVPDSVVDLRTFLLSEEGGRSDTSLLSFFIHVSDEDVLLSRMQERDKGFSPDYYEARIRDCREYGKKMKAKAPWAHWIDNSGRIEDAVDEVVGRIVEAGKAVS